MKSLRTKKKWGNCRKLFLFITKGCEHFRSFGVHSSVSAKNAIEKLQIIAKEKEAPKSKHKWGQEEEVELLRQPKNRRKVEKSKA